MDNAYARSQFPALQTTNLIYADNAGGSQVLAPVIQYISDYYTKTNAQLGGLYEVSKTSSQAVQSGLESGSEFINAEPNEVAFGSSTTQLFTNLSLAMKVSKGEEIIVSEMDHEANIAPWLRLAEIKQLKVIPWKVRKDTQQLDLDELNSLLSEKTRFVTVTHSSNMLGTVNPVKQIAAIVHKQSKAQIIVDGVAFAPHRRVDVKDLGVDFYCFSWYKVYGPHIAMLYASTQAQERLNTLGHYFHTGTDLSTKIGLAGGAYELQSAITSVVKYIKSLGHGSLDDSFKLIAQHEEELQTIIMTYMFSKPQVFEIFGSQSMSAADRMPLISFTIKGMKSSDVVDAIHKKSRFGVRNGHMYSKRLMDHLGCDEEYAIRISLCHYNSKGEAEQFVKILDEIVTERNL